MVCKLYLSTRPLNWVYFLPVGNFTLSHLGFPLGGITVVKDSVLIDNFWQIYEQILLWYNRITVDDNTQEGCCFYRPAGGSTDYFGSFPTIISWPSAALLLRYLLVRQDLWRSQHKTFH